MIWKPHVTVAAIAEHDGRFLLVEERVHDTLVINNPAGHLEESESFIDAVRRETLEETGWEFEPDAVTGIYLLKNLSLDATFLRIAFCGHCTRHHPDRPLDRGIIGPRWLARAELDSASLCLRSPSSHTALMITWLAGDFLWISLPASLRSPSHAVTPAHDIRCNA